MFKLIILYYINYCFNFVLNVLPLFRHSAVPSVPIELNGSPPFRSSPDRVCVCVCLPERAFVCVDAFALMLWTQFVFVLDEQTPNFAVRKADLIVLIILS